MRHSKGMKDERASPAAPEQRPNVPERQPPAAGGEKISETGGPPGPEPTRYGDWERGGRCVDF
jgi:hypothetical protein